MTPQEAYDKYKHLDGLLSDRDFMGPGFLSYILADLWQAIKAAVVTDAEALDIASGPQP